MRLRNDTKSLFLKCNLIFGIEIYIFIHYNFFVDKIDLKVVGFLLTTMADIINLTLLTSAFPKSHKNLLKPTFKNLNTI